MKKYYLQTTCAAIITGAFVLPSTANAGLAELEALQAANANLVLQYSFEGSDDSTRLADGSANAFTLQRVAGTDGGDVNNIQFVTGFDGVSQAYQPSFDTSSYRIGAGLNSISTTIPFASTVTVEAVARMDNFVLPTGGSGAYILDGRPPVSNGRAYFMRQVETDRITATLGDTFGDQVAALDPYVSGEWYYLALTASYDSGGNQTTVTWWGANLTQGDLVLTQLNTDNTLFQGDWTGDTQIGVGNFLNGSQEYFQGSIDNVALTGQILGQGALQQRLSALYVPVPEPSTFALLGFGGLALLFGRRRK